MYLPSSSRLKPAAPSERGRLFCKGEMGRRCPTQLRCTSVCCPRRTAHIRKTKAMHPAQIKWRSHPNAHRRRSRRSNTRLGKRTNAKLRPRTQPKPQRHSQPKRAPAAKAAAAAPGWANAPTQVKGRAPSSNPGGTANLKAYRRHSRRSNTRQDKRASARLRPSTQSKSQRHSQPKRAPAAKAAAATLSRINSPAQD